MVPFIGRFSSIVAINVAEDKSTLGSWKTVKNNIANSVEEKSVPSGCRFGCKIFKMVVLLLRVYKYSAV